MELALVRQFASKIELVRKEKISQSEKKEFQLNYSPQFPKTDTTQQFRIVFMLKLVGAEGYTLDIDYHAYFHVNEPITAEFKASSFPIVNAPAIAFPFLRAFISTLTLNAGYKPLILPSINFAQAQKQLLKSTKTAADPRDFA